jgi:hypothetical protein
MLALTYRSRRVVGCLLSSALLLLVLSYTLHSLAAPESTLSVSTTVLPQESIVTITGAGYAAGEAVSLWQTFPDFTVSSLTQQVADDNGSFTVSVFLGKELPIGRHTITAHGTTSGREEYADLELTLAQGPQPSEPLSLSPQADVQGAIVMFAGTGFVPGEAVSLWGRYPDGGSFNLAVVVADEQGRLAVQLGFGGNPTGAYVFSAQGLSSGLFSFAEMVLNAGDLNGATEPAMLSLRPNTGEQRLVVGIDGTGFAAGETVALWTTMPDFSTRALAEVVADDAGRFVLDLYLDETIPVGQHTFSARGNASARLATAPFFLEAGGEARQP